MPRSAFSRRLIWLAVLGYGYLAVLIGVLVLAIVLMVVSTPRLIQLVWIPLGLLLLVLSALRVRFDPAEGIRLTQFDAPRLFDVTEEIARQTEAPVPHEVVLSSDINAAILDVPRFGIFGSRRTLVIGLPLLRALPEDEMRAVLAHEFAHLSRRHGRTRAWATRLSTTWTSLAIVTQWNRTWDSFLFVPFFQWYGHRLERVLESQSREHEHESDTLAGRTAGRGAMSRALIRIALLDSFATDVFWPATRRTSKADETPPSDVISRLVHVIARCPADARAAEWLRAALEHRALDADSHPDLRQRLAVLDVPAESEHAMGLLAALRQNIGASAADVLLGADEVKRYAAELSTSWAAAHAIEWRHLHADARIAALEDVDSVGEAALRDAVPAQARWIAACEEPSTAIAHLRELTARAPQHDEPRMLLGRLLVEHGARDDRAAGAQLLEEAMAADSNLACDAAVSLERHYMREGRPSHARRCHARAAKLRTLALAALRERGVLRHRDKLRAFPLPAYMRSMFTDVLRGHPEIRRAYLVQKQTRYLTSSPLGVLAIEITVPWHRPTFGRTAQEASEALASELFLPGGADLVILPVDKGSDVHRRLGKVPGALLYGAGAPAFAVASDGEWHAPPLLSRSAIIWLGTTAAVAVTLVVVGMANDPAPSTAAERLDAARIAVSNDPGDPQANLELTYTLMDLERYEEGLPAAEKALRLNPQVAGAHNSLGWALAQHDRYEEAAAHFGEAIELEPQHPWAQMNLGMALYRLERYEEAKGAYEEALRIQPRNPDAHFEYAWVQAELNEFGRAEAALREAMRLDPSGSHFAGALGIMLKQQGRTQEALQIYRDATDRFPDDVAFWVEIGVLEHVHGRHAEAVAAFRTAERLQPDIFEQHDVGRGMLAASIARRQYDPDRPD